MFTQVEKNFSGFGTPNLPGICGVLKKALMFSPLSLCAFLIVMYARIEES
jgi:hypothetical protein